MWFKQYNFISLFFCFFILTTSIYATHIVGGELNYKCLGNDSYEISLTVYRDCYNGSPQAIFDDPAAIGIFDANNDLVNTLFIPFISDDTLQPILNNGCIVVPADICVHTTTYIDTINLPFINGGYQLAYQRCCRNQTILNLVEPLATGATFYNFISEEALLNCNTSAVFKAWPPIMICVNEPINFDHSAIDLDGDSLVYSLCTPLDGATPNDPQPQPPYPPPYDTVVWNANYTVNDMLGGIPFSIDAETGLLSGTPNTVGQFVVGICVEEYQNGILISTSRRDFQYNIYPCEFEVVASFFAPSIKCDTALTLSFDNFSSGTNMVDEFLWNFGDGTTSTLDNPIHTFSDTGTYLIQLIAEPNSNCQDTFSQEIGIYFESLEANFDINYNPCTDNANLIFEDNSTDSLSQVIAWEWFVNGNIISTIQSPNLTFNQTGDYEIILNVEAATGCIASDTQSLTIDNHPINIDLSDTSLICSNAELTLEVLNLNSNDTLTYNWTPSSSIIAGITTATPTIFTDTSRFFYVDITNQYGCTYRDSIFIDVNTLTPPLEINTDISTIFNGQSTQLIATQNPTYQYNWQAHPSLSNLSIYNPIVTPSTTTTYSLDIIDEFGCTNTAQITILVKDLECTEPYIFIPNAFSPNLDGQNDILYVRGNNIETLYLAIYNRWGELVFETTDINEGWDGKYNGIDSPIDVFGYVLDVKCLGGATYFKKGNISLIR